MSYSVSFSVLTSGSKGNSTYIECGEGAVLVDSGLSAREIVKRTLAAGGDPGRVRAILLTHEHSDHLRGVVPLARKLKVPVYATALTLNGSSLPQDVSTVCVNSGQSFVAAGFKIRPFSVPHDAADPVGYTLEHDSIRIGLATDLGYGTALVRERLTDCRALILESNHDERMLMDGPYPWFLKQRVGSRRGHLSNTSSSGIIEEVAHAGLESVTLAHLSEVNNEPELALDTAREVFGRKGQGTILRAASPYDAMPLVRIEI